MNNLKKITVNASKSYDILVGNNLIKDIGEIFIKRFSNCKVAIITDNIVDKLYSSVVEKSLTEKGFSVCKFVFNNGEKSKNFKTYIEIVNFLAKEELSRTGSAPQRWHDLDGRALMNRIRIQPLC